MSITSFKLLPMRGKTKIPHMRWMAFFISFVIWFNHAPLMVPIQRKLGISDGEVEIILLLGGCSLVSVSLAHYLEEPRGFISEIMPDGSIAKIELE